MRKFLFGVFFAVLFISAPVFAGEPVLTSVGGKKHDIFQAPAWDYENGLRITVTSTSAATALSEGLWLFIAEGDDVYYTVGTGTPVADGSAAESRFLGADQSWAETIVGDDKKIALIRKTSDAILWAIPALTE